MNREAKRQTCAGLTWRNPKHKSRNISKRVMQSLANEREDIGIIIGGQHHLARDYEIDERYAVQLERALKLARGEQ